MLDGGVMSSLVDRFSDTITKLTRLIIFRIIFGRDDPRGITCPSGSDSIIKGVVKIILELDDRLRAER